MGFVEDISITRMIAWKKNKQMGTGKKKKENEG